MAFDAFLQLTGADGESKDSALSGQIQLQSFSFGASNTGSASHGTGMGTGKSQMQDFSFIPTMDKATPKLFLFCANGKHIDKGVLSVQKSGGDKMVFYKTTFSDILVSSFTCSGGGGDDLPHVSVTFNFTKIEMEYTPQNQDGSKGGAVLAGWDVKANTKA